MKPDKHYFLSKDNNTYSFAFSKDVTSDLPRDTVSVLTIGVTKHSGYYLPILKDMNGQLYVDWGWFSRMAFNNVPQDFVNHVDKVVKLLMFL